MTLSMTERLMTPDQLKKKQENDKKKEEYEKKIKLIFNKAFSSDEGIQALRIIYDWCGYAKNCAVVDQNTTEILPIASQHNEALRSLYLRIRRRLNKNILIAVEMPSGDDEIDIFE